MTDVAVALELAQEKLRRDEHRKLYFYHPYGFQVQLHSASADYKQVLLMAANQVGKTFSGTRDIAFHMTGSYPDWWEGRRYARPVKVWASGTTNEKTRDILQSEFLGDPKDASVFGTGAIPGDLIVDKYRKPGIPNALSSFAVRHASGGVSTCTFKSYEMTQKAFMGESVDIILLDEEPPEDIYSQCLVRILRRSGYVLMTFTPEEGLTALVAGFLNEPQAGQIIINATWDDAPHLKDEDKEQILAATPPHQRDMRSKGIPMLGSGRVFPVSEEKILCKPFHVPGYWRFIAGIDFGFDHPTACASCAWDRDTDTFYVVDCYRKSSKAESTEDGRLITIPEHAKSIREMIGTVRVAWPHDGNRHDSGSGEGLAQQYRACGLRMLPQHATNPPGPGQREGQGGNSVEPGIQAMLSAMEAGRFKVFDTPANAKWLQEFRIFHRKEGLIVKHNDDLMSATRYAYMCRRWAHGKDTPKRPGVILETNPLEAVL